MTIETDLKEEETVTTLGEEITFEDLRIQLNKKIENWDEYYVLVDKDSETEITTNAVLDKIIANAQNNSKTNMTILCKHKFVFFVVDKTDSKENSFELPYFRSSTATFATFSEKITMNCSSWNENHKIIHNGTGTNDVIKNDHSFNSMIDGYKYGQETTIPITLKPKVYTFCYFFRYVLFSCEKRWKSREISKMQAVFVCVLQFFCFCDSGEVYSGGRFIQCEC